MKYGWINNCKSGPIISRIKRSSNAFHRARGGSSSKNDNRIIAIFSMNIGSIAVALIFLPSPEGNREIYEW